jgi:hypothetical protein
MEELWSFPNAMLFMILLILLFFGLFYGASVLSDLKTIKDNWPQKRCNPSIMPFASFFGHDAKENFDYCMGNIFSSHSQSMLSSSSDMFSSFTGVLSQIFGSINSLRLSMANMGGGINSIFKEFTERISMFFFRLRISAITIKTLMGRMYATLFSVMFMGLSGMTGMTTFTNTTMYAFLDKFCFPGDTELLLEKGPICIKDIKIGDIILPTSNVTGTFRFYAKGQPMVKIGKTIVSTNHYIVHNGKNIKAVDHPDAIAAEYCDDLYCLNTGNNRIPINGLTFLDYDETATADKDTMNYIEGRVNACSIDKEYSFTEYCPAVDENTYIKTTDGLKLAKDITLGDTLTTGSNIVGLIRRLVNETSVMNGEILTPSTLYWDKNTWKRVGDNYEIIKGQKEMVSFIAVPNSQIELENVMIRDYMELCSPDSEIHYTKQLESQ